MIEKQYAVTAVVLCMFLLIPIPVFAQSKTICLNEDGTREIDFRYTVGVQEFDELNKKVYVTVDFDADDEDKQTEPFEVFHRKYPHLGSTVVHIMEDDDQGYFQTEPNQKFHEREITPIPNSPVSLWPFDTYKMPMFLDFNKDVKLCYETWDNSSDDIHVYKAGTSFPENPYWTVEIEADEITLEQLKELIPEARAKFDDSTLFQFNTIISHTDNYQAKISAYLFLVFVPIIPMIGHLLWFRFEKLSSHITFFTGVSILILTSIIAVSELSPIDLTLVEIISIGSITFYAIGFSIFLMKRHRSNW